MISTLRKRYGDITQTALAEACNTYPQKIQRLETGETDLRVKDMEMLAEGFTKLGYPTQPFQIITDQESIEAEHKELTKKISSLRNDLRQQHIDYLDYLLEKQKKDSKS